MSDFISANPDDDFVEAPKPAPRRTIMDALYETRTAFRRLNMEPPKVIEITAEEGRFLMAELEGYMISPRGEPPRPHIVTAELPMSARAVDIPYREAKAILEIADHTSQTFMQIEWMGMKIRWPATAMATFKHGSTILY